MKYWKILVKREGSPLSGARNLVLRTGPILQASVDLSTSYMQTEISTIDNIFQRLGRVVRWSEAENGKYEIFIPNNTDFSKGSIVKNLSLNGQYEIVLKFIEFLQNEIFTKPKIKLNDLYKLYFDFFNVSGVNEAYEITWENLKKFLMIFLNKILSQLKPIPLAKKVVKWLLENP